MSEADDLTRLLADLADGGGDPVLERLLARVYDELHRLASRAMRRERSDHTLQATALVHEAFLRLADGPAVRWQDRAHFFGIAARLMRQILVDHARKHNASKRGGDVARVTLDEGLVGGGAPDLDLLALNEALEQLAAKDERTARVAELRLFAGASVAEVAEVLGVSKRTVDDEWAFGRMWLGRALAVP